MSDGLSDSEIADRLGEPEQMVGNEVRGVLTELGFRTRTHAIVYVLAREISDGPKDADQAPPETEPEGNERDEERPA